MLTVFPVLSIAGSDSSGGAGIQADIKTISAIGCYAMTAVTAITAQNTCGVTRVDGVDPEMVRAQCEAVFADIPPLCVKTGMLYSASIISAVADVLEAHPDTPLVLDPVMISTSGSRLIAPEAIGAMVERLFPLATLVTPNQSESVALTGKNDYRDQIAVLHSMGARGVLIKGGDSEAIDIKTDYLSTSPDEKTVALTADAIHTVNSHGTGCTLSSAIASYIALGYPIADAVRRGKLFVTRALHAGAMVKVGEGHGPVNHLYSPRKMKIRNIKHKPL